MRSRSNLVALVVIGLPALSAGLTSCNALLGTPEPMLRDGGTSSVESGSADASDAASETSETSEPTIDSGGDGDIDGHLPDDAGSDAPSLVCPDSCPDGGCVLATCPVRVIGGLNRLVAVVADSSPLGSVYFGDFDTGRIYEYSKPTWQVRSYASLSAGTTSIAVNASTVYWSTFSSQPSDHNAINQLTRGGATSREVADTSLGLAWAGPWAMGIDTSFVYWCDRYGADCWRMDLALTTPQRIFRELLPDGAPSHDQLYGGIAVDPGDDGFVFFIAANHLYRVSKSDFTSLEFAAALGQAPVGIDNGYVYWLDAAGALRRAPETIPSCDGRCEVVVPAGPHVGGPSAFDDTYVYWSVFDTTEKKSLIARARKDGASPNIEILVHHTGVSSVAVDGAFIYYTTQHDNGVNATGSFWRLAK